MTALLDDLALLPREEAAGALATIDDAAVRGLLYGWEGVRARSNQLPPLGAWRVWLILAGRGFGKALYLGMELPTPTGWTTMGDVQVGDTLFDERGEPCTVTFVTDVMYGRPCYDVVFDDGTVIVADGEHQWLTWTKAARKSVQRRIAGDSPRHVRPQSAPRSFPSVVTTDDIKATLRVANSKREVNHSIPTCGPVACAEADLSIHPYVLGAWLGDGDSKAAVLTSADPEVLDEIRNVGYGVGDGKQDARSRAVRYAIDCRPYARDHHTGRMVANGSLHSALRALNLLRNKHIPPRYLRASTLQRLSLLQGLMDTDGSVATGGHCEFMSTQWPIASGLFELCASLGLKPVLSEGRATYRGKDIGPRYRITFTPHVPVFRLARKAERLHRGKTQQSRTHHRYIVDVRPRESVPVRCIQVDSPSHLFLCSRSFVPTHNTRTGAEWVRAEVEAGRRGKWAFVGATSADVRDVMVEGESGILRCASPWCRPHYEPSKRRLTWPNGATATMFSGDEPDQLRGPNRDGAWGDELAKWKYPQETWDNLEMVLRAGNDPRAVVTTTPRPIPVIRELLTDAQTVVVRGSTYDNAVNLAPSFLQRILTKYEGTRLGRQELHAEILEDNPAALWQRALLEQHRVLKAPTLTRIVVGVDPEVSSAEDSAETGIVVAAKGSDGHGYVLDDCTFRGTPHQWASAAITAYHKWHANLLVAETNQGGEMVRQTIQSVDATVPYKGVHASHSKQARAEPVAALYEQGRIHHVGTFGELEDQQCQWVAGTGPSPDRLDALVWALTELLLDEHETGFW
jgi:phage terminase large subunit-like protein